MFFSGLLPLFLLAHFGHHVVGAMLNPLMPMIRNDLGLNYTQAGLVISAFSITGGISNLPAGWLADRFGTRLMVLISVSGVALAGFLVGLSNSYITLIILLVLVALLGGGYHPSSASAISTFIPMDRRGRALGLHLIGGTASFWLVPLLAAPIAVAWGWRGSYMTLTVPIIILGIALYLLLGRQTKVKNQPEPSTQQTLPETSQIQWRILLPFLVLTIGTGMITQSIAAYYSLFAVDHLKTPEATAAALMAITPAVGAFAAPTAGYIADRFGTVPVLIIVSLIAAPLLYTLNFVTGVPSFIAVLLFTGTVNMMRVPASEAYFVSNIPLHRRSTILGIYFFAGAELAGVMTPLVGRFIDTVGFSYVFTGAAVAQTVIAVVCSFFLWRSRVSKVKIGSD